MKKLWIFILMLLVSMRLMGVEIISHGSYIDYRSNVPVASYDVNDVNASPEMVWVNPILNRGSKSSGVNVYGGYGGSSSIGGSYSTHGLRTTGKVIHSYGGGSSSSVVSWNGSVGSNIIYNNGGSGVSGSSLLQNGRRNAPQQVNAGSVTGVFDWYSRYTQPDGVNWEPNIDFTECDVFTGGNEYWSVQMHLYWDKKANMWSRCEPEEAPLDLDYSVVLLLCFAMMIYCILKIL